MATQVEIAWCPVEIGACCIPVRPGDRSTDASMEERTERCAQPAHWLVGAALTCDDHMRNVCEAGGWDYDQLVAEATADQHLPAVIVATVGGNQED